MNIQIDNTALYLIGVVAGPVAQHLVDGSILTFTEANITCVVKKKTCFVMLSLWQCRNISDGGFDLSLAGALTDIGPLDAAITFTEPLRYVLS